MRTNPVTRALQYVALLLVVTVFTAPTLWMILGVFKRNVEHRARPPVLIPSDPIGAASDTIRFAFEGSPVPLDQVFLNSVEQREGIDFVVRDGTLVFERDLAKEQLGVGRWTSMVFGIAGSYGKNDTVDVVYERNGRPAVASKLPFEVAG